MHTHRLVFSKKFAQLDLGASLGPLAKPGLDMVWDVFKQLVLFLKVAMIGSVHTHSNKVKMPARHTIHHQDGSTLGQLQAI